MTKSPFDLSGKVAVVTGGGRGLGQAMAGGLAAAGANLVVAARSGDEVAAVAETLRAGGAQAESFTFDATRREDSEALVAFAVERFGRLDVLLANHGVGFGQRAEETDDQIWSTTLAVNLTGAFYCCQAAARRMIAAGHGGSIIVTSSTGSLVAFRGLLAYGASKGGVDQMVRQMAMEWGPHGIRVNAINPGYTNHHMRGGAGRHSDPEQEAELARRTPLGRRGDPEEFVGPAVFLASEASSFVTGITLPVDGGYCAV